MIFPTPNQTASSVSSQLAHSDTNEPTTSNQASAGTSIAELLRRKKQSVQPDLVDLPQDSPKANSDEESYDSNDESINSAEQLVDEIFNNEENQGDDDAHRNEEVAAVPVLFPQLAPIMWTMERVFNKQQELDEFLKQEGWVTRSTRVLNSAKKTLYRCDKMKRMGEQCQAEVYVLHKIIVDDDDDELPAGENVPNIEENAEENIEQNAKEISPNVEENAEENIEQNAEEIAQPGVQPIVEENQEIDDNMNIGRDVFELYRKNRQHNHDELKNLANPKVKEHVEKRIIELIKLKPQTIQFTLRDCEDIDADDQPTARQIRNIIDKYNKKTFGKDKITMRQLTEFVDKHNNKILSVLYNNTSSAGNGC